MSDAKKLLGGIILVAVGIGMFLSGSSFVSIIGGLLGAAGAITVGYILWRGKI